MVRYEPTLTPGQKNAWIADLTSGEFTQGTGALRQRDPDDPSRVTHCCLGVLAEGLELEWCVSDDPFIGDVINDPKHIVALYLPDYVLDLALQDEFAVWNDSKGRTFEEIAIIVEDIVPVTDD